ncbi:MAG: hypothetical protein ACK4ND_02365 [Cytophagaceae bacterium]
MITKLPFIFCIFLLTFASPKISGQELSDKEIIQSEKCVNKKSHFISINPIKPFIGLPNVFYEYQIKKKIGVTAFSEILAYTVIPNFNHPDAVNTIGFSFYPFMDNQTINHGLFININTSYITYFRDRAKGNSFANGIQIGHKWLLKRSIFLEPKLVLNYSYKGKNVMPGMEFLVGINI